MNDDTKERIDSLQILANKLKESSNFFEALKKYDEMIQLQRQSYGSNSEEVYKTQGEIAIICNILSMQFLQKEEFQMSQDLLHRAEQLSEGNNRLKAVTYNNYACLYRKTKKLRGALTYLEKALEIEYKCLNDDQKQLEECIVISNPCDIHLNICAILSQMEKHEMALQHAMKALVLIQDELVTRAQASKEEGEKPKNDDRFIVLSIAYHNIAVEQEFLKSVRNQSYKKSYESAQRYLGEQHPMTGNMKDVFDQALNVMAGKIEKQVQRKVKGQDAPTQDDIVGMLKRGIHENDIELGPISPRRIKKKK